MSLTFYAAEASDEAFYQYLPPSQYPPEDDSMYLWEQRPTTPSNDHALTQENLPSAQAHMRTSAPSSTCVEPPSRPARQPPRNARAQPEPSTRVLRSSSKRDQQRPRATYTGPKLAKDPLPASYTHIRRDPADKHHRGSTEDPAHEHTRRFSHIDNNDNDDDDTPVPQRPLTSWEREEIRKAQQLERRNLRQSAEAKLTTAKQLIDTFFKHGRDDLILSLAGKLEVAVDEVVQERMRE